VEIGTALCWRLVSGTDSTLMGELAAMQIVTALLVKFSVFRYFL